MRSPFVRKKVEDKASVSAAPSAMDKRLRREFILAAMAAVTIVLTGIIGCINVANYRAICEKADAKVNLIAENGGLIPGMANDVDDEDADHSISATSVHLTVTQSDRKDSGVSIRRSTRRFTGPLDPDKIMNLEQPYSTRYFTVTVDSAGELLTADVARIASVDRDEAEAFVKKVSKRHDARGFYGSYRYGRMSIGESDSDTSGESDEDSPTLYVFLDCSRELTNFHSFLTLSIIISLVGWLAVLALVIVLSQFVVRPVVESYEKQKRFITDASHEIKTPLAVIDAANEVQEIENGESEWTQSIHEQVARLTALTERLVFLARMDEGALGFVRAELDLSDLVVKAAEPFESVALSRGKRLSCDIEPNVKFKGDKSALSQVVELLLDNATRYAVDGTEIELKLVAEPHGHALLTVTNAVDAVPSGSIDRLFDRFYRADASRNSKTGGSGVGLSVARAIVEAHGGTIKATASDASITFAVRL